MDENTQDQQEQQPAVEEQAAPAAPAAPEAPVSPGPEGAGDPTAGSAVAVTYEQAIGTAAGVDTVVPPAPGVQGDHLDPAAGTPGVAATQTPEPGVQADGTAVIAPGAHAEAAAHLETLKATLDKPKNEWEKVKADIALAVDRLEVLLHLKPAEPETPLAEDPPAA